MRYAEHRRAVLAYCARRLDHQEAADACAETFLIAWKKRADVPPSPHTLPYLYGIAHNVVRNHRRGGRRRMRLGARLFGLAEDRVPEDPPTVVVQREANRDVQAALGRLSSTDREIVMLYAWEDLSREEIARMMGISRAAVDQRIHRAYRKLSRLLRPMHTSVSRLPPSIIEEGGGT